MLIREERPEDRADVRRVNEQAFGQPGEADLVDALRAAGAVTLSMVAAAGADVIGHILFSPVALTSATRTFAAVGLGPMAVLPAWQRRGVGAALVRAGLDGLRDRGHQIVVVLGHPAYYPRFGFRRASELGIRWEHDAPDDAFMVRALTPPALEGVQGVVSYHPAFSAV